MIVAGMDCGKAKIAVARLNTETHKLKVTAYTSEATRRAEQLLEIGLQAWKLSYPCDVVYIEEPLIGRNVRSSLYVAMTAGAAGSYMTNPAYFVSNTAWKKAITGRGNANKKVVSSWLNANHATYSLQCDGDQDLIDATCIALYGAGVQEVASGLLSH